MSHLSSLLRTSLITASALAGLITSLTLTAPQARAAEKRTLCVYDPSGANGDIFQMMKDYQVAALEWGVKVELKPYTDEKIASEDFKAKQCDGVLMTGTRGRALNSFSSTIEAMGAIPTYQLLKSIITPLLSSPKGAAVLNPAGSTEVAAIFPGGAVYLLVRDRAINSVERLAGKNIATLDFDEAAKTMVRHVKASMSAADVSTFAGMFNNGNVDAAYAPATAYKALELYKGVGKAGGVIRFPLAQMTLQLFVHSDRFPAEFGAQSRVYSLKSFERALKAVSQTEGDIQAASWIDISGDDKGRYEQMFLDVRVGLRDANIYNAKALKVMRMARCKEDGSRAECAQNRE
jgi:hypothetical protein